MRKSACFVICPIGREGSKERALANEVTHHLIGPAVENDFEVTRGDLLNRSGEITPELRTRIRRDALVIADLTNSNPNVMYEIGLRHAVGLPCIHIARKGTVLPFDVKDHKTVFYDLSMPSNTQRSIEDLRAHVREAMTSDGTPVAQSPIELWAEMSSILNPELPEAEYGPAVDKVFEIIRKASHGPQPVLRLWGGRGRLEKAERERFELIGAEVGRSCATNGMAIACTDIHPETIEYWALKGAKDAVRAGAAPLPVYLHFNVADTYAKGTASRQLISEVEDCCRMVEIPYPYADADRLKALSNEIRREQVTAHDARLGSLLQSDAVVLLGSHNSAKHLIQLMSFVDRHHIRAAKPLLFVPLPWIGGMGRTAYQEFRGVVDDADFVTRVTT